MTPLCAARTAPGWLDGLVTADELKARLGLAELPRETTSDYQTVGGMVTDNLGRVPTAGD